MLHLDPATFVADPHAAARALIEEQIALLGRLARIGLEIAEAAGRAAASEDTAAAGADPALTYARAARAVRLSIALQSRLSKDLAGLDQAERRAAAVQAGARRGRIHRTVEQLIEAASDEADGADADEVERLSSQAWERLADTDDAELAGRSFDEIVAAICRDLGLAAAPSAGPASDADATAPSLTAPPGLAAPDLAYPNLAAPDPHPPPARAPQGGKPEPPGSCDA